MEIFASCVRGYLNFFNPTVLGVAYMIHNKALLELFIGEIRNHYGCVPRQWLETSRAKNTLEKNDIWLSNFLSEEMDPWYENARLGARILSEAAYVINPGDSLGDIEFWCGVREIVDYSDRARTTIFWGTCGEIIFLQKESDPQIASCLDLHPCCTSRKPLDFWNIRLALAHSWDKNPDRERARKARNFLCDAVEEILNDAGL